MKGSMYSDVGLGAAGGSEIVGGLVNVTGVVVGLAMRRPWGRSQAKRDVRGRLGVVSVDFGAGGFLSFGLSFALALLFSGSLLWPEEVGLSPATAPLVSLRL